VLHGHEPRQWGIEASGSCTIANVHTWLTERCVIHDLLRQNLPRAQQITKKQADKNRMFREFKVDDLVLIYQTSALYPNICGATSKPQVFIKVLWTI
jgi:hypothetical protein